MRRTTGHALRWGALLAMLALLVAACDNGDGETQDADEDATAETDGEGDDGGGDDGDGAAPAEGGTITVARSADVDNLDPHLATAFQSREALELIYETLVEFDEDLNVTEGLAEEWQYSEDGQTLTFTLRDDVRFHDGEDLTSADVAATIERLLDGDSGAVAGSNFLTIDSIDTPDDHTVELSLSEPDQTLPAAFADANAAIVRATAIEDGTIEDEPTGTGAFTFDEWQQGEAFRLAANDDYWRDGPLADAVDIRVVPEQSSIAAGIQSANFHIGILEDPSIVLTLPEDNFDVHRPDALAYRALMLNQGGEGLDAPEVRQAIACAIDREGLIEAAALGEGRVTGPFTAPEWQFEPLAGLPCDPPDPDAARDLLDEAGHGDGLTLDTIINADGYATSVAEGQALQAQLEEIGVELDLDILESGVYVQRWIEADFDAAVALNGGRPDPHHMYARYFHSDGDLNAVATHQSGELDSLIEEGRAAEEGERESIYQEVAETLEADAPWAWLYTGYEYRVALPEVEGFTAYPDGSLRSLREVSIGQ